MIRKPLLLIVAIILYFNLNAQQTYPNTFLWRISGNGLMKPSYLYGTMHLQDRRLFAFGDSIYHAIEVSDGFAIELNPVEMMDSIVKFFAKEDKSPLLKNLLKKDEYDKVARDLEKKLKIPADQITTKKIADERSNWLYAHKQKSDMPTFMDLYLYTIAQNQGKYVGGIEDLEDQAGLLDDIGGTNIKEYAKEDDKSRLQYLEKMKTVYVSRDLNKIQELTYGSAGSYNHDYVLINRNIKMAKRMDSLSHIRNSFFAIGAAHLPGDSGVISLLRSRGFIVEPVASKNYLQPEDYHYTKKEIKWVKIEDENKLCSVQMPGAPRVVNIENVIPMHLYIDLPNTFVYGMSVMPTSSGAANEDSILSKITVSYKAQGFDILSIKKVNSEQGKAQELVGKREGYFYRFRLYLKGNKLFLLIFGAQQLERTDGPESVKYFNSLVINDSGLNRKIAWQLFSDKVNAFSALMPGKPILKMEKAAVKNGYDAYAYTSSDYNDGSFYNVTIKNILPGYFLPDDSSSFNELKKSYTLFSDSGITETSEFVTNGYHGYKLMATKKFEGKDYVFQIREITRGNRIYMPIAITEKSRQNSESVQNFFNSFTLLPFKQSDWQQRVSPAADFSAWAPSPLEYKAIDSSALTVDTTASLVDTSVFLKNNIQNLYSHDNNSVVTYCVEIKVYSPYYWSNSDSGFFKNLTDGYKADDDTLISYRLLGGDTVGADLLIKIHNSGLYKKMRALLNGDTLYTLYSYVPLEIKDDKDVNLFFTGFTFVAKKPTTIFTNKKDKLIYALQSPDSLSRNNALEVLQEISFTSKDLEFLHDAWLKPYPSNGGRYNSVNYQIMRKIAELDDSSTVDFIGANYKKFDTASSDMQMDMLEVLGTFTTARSYALLKKLLLLHPPASGSVYSLSNDLGDSLLLSQNLFPEVSSLYTDSIVGSALIKLTVELLDSNLLRLDDVKKDAALIYALADNQLKEIMNDADAYPVYNNYVIDLLGKINSKQSLELLQRFLQLPDKNKKYNAAVALIAAGQPVSTQILHKLAADNEFTANLYADLKKMHKVNLFPKEFLTQPKFVAAWIYNYMYEDYDSVVIQQVGERTSKAAGGLHKYYLYKVSWLEDEKMVSHLVICGPLSLDKSDLEINEDEVQLKIFDEEKYNPTTVQKLFLDFMKSESGRLSGSSTIK